MAWQGILGHDELVEQFRRILARQRLATTYLFVGPQGVGKFSFALRLAQTLLCQTQPAHLMAPCGHCAGCLHVLSGTHPDLLTISRPADRAEIPVALLIGPPERRMREGLCHDLYLKPFMGGRRVAIIDDADSLNEEGANCLLKTLEEPPPQSVLILVGTSAQRQLPTIRSRSQLVRFGPLAPDVLAHLIQSTGLAADATTALALARFSDGSLARAARLAAGPLLEFRAQLLERLSAPVLDSVELSKVVAAFLDEAGKEASLRRERGRQVVGFAIEFYRHLWRALCGAMAGDDAVLNQAVARAAAGGCFHVELAIRCAERCLAALEHIDRFANQSTWLECWLDDLAQLVSREGSLT